MKTQISRVCAAIVSILVVGIATACSAEEPSDGASQEPAAAQPATPQSDASAPAGTGEKMTALERVQSAEKGTLKNPFSYKDEAIVAEGKKIYLGASCNGCHGGGGGGGMCPPLTNETWVYGGDDDTLFRLITLGTDELRKTYGLSRKGQENVVGPMPAFKDILSDEEKLWKAIAFIRSVWGGREEKIQW